MDEEQRRKRAAQRLIDSMGFDDVEVGPMHTHDRTVAPMTPMGRKYSREWLQNLYERIKEIHTPHYEMKIQLEPKRTDAADTD